jgi:hypothetical protein
MKNRLPIIIAFLVGGAFGIGGVLLARPVIPVTENYFSVATHLREGQTVTEAETSLTFTDERLGFSLKYPKELKAAQFDEGGGASTIVFQGSREEEGFQIFITPHDSAQITQDRIKADLQGFPMENLQEIVLTGGIRAIHFESESPIIGESSEVWFIHNAFLYQVTTYRARDAWLAEILSTLHFEKK